MNWKRLGEAGSYLFVSLVSVGLAAYLSLQFLSPAKSQEDEAPPSSEEQAVDESVPSYSRELMEGEAAAPEDLGPRPEFPSVDADSTASAARELEVFLEPYIYDAGERRNPFETFEDLTLEKGVPQSPLQKYSLSDLKLLGIMWDIKNPKAMFVDPNSTVHVVGRDEGIGLKNGYIAAIREGEVVIVEAERKEAGIVYETKVLRLER